MSKLVNYIGSALQDVAMPLLSSTATIERLEEWATSSAPRVWAMSDIVGSILSCRKLFDSLDGFVLCESWHTLIRWAVRCHEWTTTAGESTLEACQEFQRLHAAAFDKEKLICSHADVSVALDDFFKSPLM